MASQIPKQRVGHVNKLITREMHQVKSLFCHHVNAFIEGSTCGTIDRRCLSGNETTNQRCEPTHRSATFS
jgi:hypothetical protein